jgi:hypothetical protein
MADVNGDGYDDAILAAGRYDGGSVPTRAGGAFLFLGGPDGLDSTYAWDQYGSVTSADQIVLSRIGDTNGDGGEEFAIAWPQTRVARAFAGTKARGPVLATAAPLVTIGDVPVSLDASFTDEGGTGHTCEWDFGDGTTVGPAPCSPAPAHSYDGPGTYVARVRIRNDAGQSGEAATTVTVPTFQLR